MGRFRAKMTVVHGTVFFVLRNQLTALSSNES